MPDPVRPVRRSTGPIAGAVVAVAAVGSAMHVRHLVVGCPHKDCWLLALYLPLIVAGALVLRWWTRAGKVTDELAKMNGWAQQHLKQRDP